jgi:hypothetical protein
VKGRVKVRVKAKGKVRVRVNQGCVGQIPVANQGARRISVSVI